MFKTRRNDHTVTGTFVFVEVHSGELKMTNNGCNNKFGVVFD